MYLEQIWRYPVKSMGGERLETGEIRGDGLQGDRIVQVRDQRGRVITARTRPALLGHHASIGPDGEPWVDGRPWTAPEVASAVEKAAGPGCYLVKESALRRFDVLPLLIATDGAIEALGHDGRRLRPNLVIGGVQGLAERTWEGRLLRMGAALIRAVDLRGRCIMTTFDPDTLEQDTGVLRTIQQRFGGVMALNCLVVRPGPVSVNDTVELLETEDPKTALHEANIDAWRRAE